MQEWQGIVSQEGNVGVVDECGEIEGIAEESSQEVTRATSKEREE